MNPAGYRSRHYRLALAAGLLCGGGLLSTLTPMPPALAADAPVAARPKAVEYLPPVLDRNHHLGPGDKILVTVENQAELSKTVTVFMDGTFDYPVLGTVLATGLTTRELADAMAKGLLKELKRPSVQVALLEVFIPPKPPEAVKVIPKYKALGAVGRKGEIDLIEPKPLRYVLADIAPAATADLSNIRIRYPDGSARTADFSSFAETGTSKDDFLIKGGEEIILLERAATLRPDPFRISILGAVSKRGFTTVEGNISILEALDRAGGPAQGADLERVVITGPAHQSPQLVNIVKVQEGDLSANYLVQKGDEIVVNLKPVKLLLVGEVPKQGNIHVDADATLMRTLIEAGAVTSGDTGHTQIVRRMPTGKVVYLTYDVREIQKQKKPDPQLLDDDVVFVPRKKGPKGIMPFLSNALTPLWLLRSVGVGGF